MLSPGVFGVSSKGGTERKTHSHDGGAQIVGNSVLGAVGGLHPPALLAGASEVPTALLMASSTRGSAKCTFCMEMGKEKKNIIFF